MSLARVGIAQINACVGDLAGNAARVLQAARQAAGQGADVLVTPELVLTGYPPEDLLLRPRFIQEQQAVFERLCQDLAGLAGLHVVIGHVLARQDRLYNAATVVCEGRVLGSYCKRELPNYSVFDEQRYFSAHGEAFGFTVKGVRFGLNICEDIWFERAPRAAAADGAQVLLVPNASPYNTGKQEERLSVARRSVQDTGCALIYANLVGGQDELVFDGASFALDAQGRMSARLPDFTEGVNVLEVDARSTVRPVTEQAAVQPYGLEEQVWNALVLGVRDYLGKNGFPGAIIGLSGGIDSAVVLAVAVDAVGADNVRAVMMPSRYTADISLTDAADMARRLGVQYDVIAIGEVVDRFEAALAPQFAGLPVDATEENIQARARGTLLMALSNKTGRLVLTTGNKSEMTTGYCTLYGDMAGGFAVIKDVPKTLVYRLANWRNQRQPIIPERIITRPPSAELRPDQTDQDSLPPYDILDGIIERYMEHNASAADIVAAGFPREAVGQVVRLIRINEYKRRQAPPGPRITPRAFGRDWRYPVTNGFRETV
ncbi:NAD synthetase [Bordetella pertussis]|uniref:Glutamine-dependent NAD(+) synthetase n=3 Tax=Bordetella pertussis TaxID=520 RepID=Q7VVG8_BORPE|nr:NAD+ synthase [Bordetella pertussis]ETH40303.1 NAD+ synthetase [Bordetella pertussis H918]ETH44190.1 NAD+ synthetase [Bordetella pertussis H939]ETH47577.1 NAD+ synthetase [Bordetella pertussis H921]ETH71365.1 NAD+ synthetase [Bordetella pertussis STO1-CHLA-0011]ETH82064.1 NAD+ synthetase [Bordetella pertussis STO1-CHOC-0017]ETH88024.1 NAD+ synthetase [Bordetella pertussis STO1-CHOC-0018]ETH91889.1 NAD+ synthetase [Bordetella pertussis STO1-CHOC-0019]ETH99782.1 NAD+ synthetase [Bordetella